jgi:hypothetical protein
MSEQRSSNDSGGTPGSRTIEDREVAKLWEQFKSGGVARCPRDEAPMALAVDGAAKSYRLVCTRCGNASVWFEIGGAGINLRSGDDAANQGASED